MNNHSAYKRAFIQRITLRNLESARSCSRRRLSSLHENLTTVVVVRGQRYSADGEQGSRPVIEIIPASGCVPEIAPPLLSLFLPFIHPARCRPRLELIVGSGGDGQRAHVSMSRRPPNEYKPRPIAAVAAEIPYRSLQNPRTASTSGQPHHGRSQSTSSGGGSNANSNNPSGFSSGIVCSFAVLLLASVFPCSWYLQAIGLANASQLAAAADRRRRATNGMKDNEARTTAVVAKGAATAAAPIQNPRDRQIHRRRPAHTSPQRARLVCSRRRRPQLQVLNTLQHIILQRAASSPTLPRCQPMLHHCNSMRSSSMLPGREACPSLAWTTFTRGACFGCYRLR